MSVTTYCDKHPDTETNLRCGRCESLICPLCMVHTPVGVRCSDCARPTQLPTFEVSTGYLARAITVGLALAIAGGVFWSVFRSLLGLGPLLDGIAIVGLGYLIGEGISASVNRKRGRNLKFVAGGSMFAAFVVIAIFTASLSVFDLLALALGIYVAVNRFN